MILDFYNDVRDLDITEQTLMDVLPSIEDAFDSWIKHRKELSEKGFECAKLLDQISEQSFLEMVLKAVR